MSDWMSERQADWQHGAPMTPPQSADAPLGKLVSISEAKLNEYIRRVADFEARVMLAENELEATMRRESDQARKLAEAEARLVTLETERDQWKLTCEKAWTAYDGSTWSEPDHSLPAAVEKLRTRAETAEAERDALRQALTHGGTVDAADR